MTQAGKASLNIPNKAEMDLQTLAEEDMKYARFLIEQRNYSDAASLLREAANVLTAVNTIHLAKAYN